MPLVGPKGQIVISKEIRDRLGIQQGWIALERLVDDHLEVSFVPPAHNESLGGILSPVVKKPGRESADWHEIKEQAWQEAAEEKVAGWDAQRGRLP